MKPVLCAIAAISLASCAQMTQLKTATVSGMTKFGAASKESLANLMPGPKIPVVEVREKDLREIKTGKQQAMAYEKTRRGFWSSLFNGPVDFKEPELPVESAAMDGELLPPKLE